MLTLDELQREPVLNHAQEGALGCFIVAGSTGSMSVPQPASGNRFCTDQRVPTVPGVSCNAKNVTTLTNKPKADRNAITAVLRFCGVDITASKQAHLLLLHVYIYIYMSTLPSCNMLISLLKRVLCC